MRALILGLLFLTGAGTDLVGRWESVEKSQGGIGSVVELAADGSASQSVMIMRDTKYELDGSTLIECWEDAKAGGTRFNRARILLTADTLDATPEDGTPVPVLRRISPAIEPPSVTGTWAVIQHSESSGKAFDMLIYETFTADGRILIRIPARTDCGRYAVSGDTVNLMIPETGSQTFRYRIEGDRLTLIPEVGPSRYFRRAEGVPDAALTRSLLQGE